MKLQPVQAGSTVATMSYDGLGRCSSRAIANIATVDGAKNGGPAYGQYAIGHFSADGSNQTLTMEPNGFGNSDSTAF